MLPGERNLANPIVHTVLSTRMKCWFNGSFVSVTLVEPECYSIMRKRNYTQNYISVNIELKPIILSVWIQRNTFTDAFPFTFGGEKKKEKSWDTAEIKEMGKTKLSKNM